MHYKYISSSWGQNSTCISQEDFPINEIWTCSNPKGTDVSYPKLEVLLGAPDRVNIPASCMTPVSVNKMLK